MNYIETYCFIHPLCTGGFYRQGVRYNQKLDQEDVGVHCSETF